MALGHNGIGRTPVAAPCAIPLEIRLSAFTYRPGKHHQMNGARILKPFYTVYDSCRQSHRTKTLSRKCLRWLLSRPIQYDRSTMCFSFVLNGVFLVTREKEDNIFFNIRHAMGGASGSYKHMVRFITISVVKECNVKSRNQTNTWTDTRRSKKSPPLGLCRRFRFAIAPLLRPLCCPRPSPSSAKNTKRRGKRERRFSLC